MEITTQEIPQKMETLLTKIEEQKTLLTNCTDLYKTLTNHFTNLHNSIDLKSQAIAFKFQKLNSSFEQTLDSLKKREDSISELESSLTSTVDCLKSVGLSEVSEPKLDEYAPLSETLKSVCRRMDPELLTKLLVGKRRQSTALREMMSEALSECVDSARFVVEAVKGYVEMKREKKDGLTDKRLACTIVVGGMFSPTDLREKTGNDGGMDRVFSKKAVERAEEVLREWKEVGLECVKVGGGGDGSGMGPSEAAMFIEMAVGFGLKEKFEEEFYKKLMVEFCDRRDMAKLGISVFGDKVADFVEELVASGKEVEAVYFAFESGLTERFPPASLLKSASEKSKMTCSDILKKGSHSQAAADEANSMEMTFIKAVIKCVEDLKIEEQYPIENLKKRLNTLLQAKADRKKGSVVGYSKRSHPSGSRANGPPPSRPPKFQKFSNPSTTYPSKDHASPARLSPVSRYSYPYTFPSRSTYDTGLAAHGYAPTYGGAHIPAPPPAVGADQGGQQYYSVPGDNGVPGASAGTGVSSYYGSQTGYAPYDYSAAAAPVYPPPSYP